MNLLDLEIDKFNLDEEAKNHPELLRKYGKLLSKARDETLRLKRILEIVESEQAEAIRKDPKKYNVSEGSRGGVSDATVFKAVKATKPYEVAFNNYLQAKRREEDTGFTLDAIKDKGYMIKMLVELWLNNYYSEVPVYNHKKTNPILGKGGNHSKKRVKLEEY